MMQTVTSSKSSHGFLTAAALVVGLGMTAAAQRASVNGSSGASKLTTVLAELSSSVAQDQGQIAATAARVRALSVDTLPISVQDAMRARRLRINADNEVQLYILLDTVTEDTVAQLAAAGVTVEVKDAARNRVQARVPVSRLQSVAQLAIVNSIRLPTYARPRVGQATSEGDAILHADAVRTDLKLDGTGVRVGVVSDGLKGIFDSNCATCAGVSNGPMSTLDLPTLTNGLRNASGLLTGALGGIVGRSFRANGDLEGLPPATPACGFAGAGAEGTALLEIVHDLAPGARLSFANADTDVEFTQAVNFLAASNDVVLDDIGFFGEPYDGTSAVSRNTAAALNNPAYPIRAYFTAVGNEADRHYYGTYEDSGVDGATIPGITKAGRLHLFRRTADTTDVLGLGSQPYNVIQLPQNGEVAIFLTWDDPFGASGNDYDLYLVQQSTGRVVASSTDVQSGRQDPSETIDYVNRGSQDLFRIVVQNVQGAAQPRRLNIFSVQPECAVAGPTALAPPRHERHNYNTASRSLSAQADAGGTPVSVIAVGAVCSASAAAAGRSPAGEPNESCLDTSNATVEYFSSRGPTLDGRIKPDITAVDGVSITGAGGFGTTFFGTSAAAPHMGAIAALVLQSAPCLLSRTASTTAAPSARATLRNLMLSSAFGLGNPSPDNTFGAGRADAAAAVRPTLPGRTGATDLSFDGSSALGASLTATQLGFSDPNQCSLTTMNWTGACGTGPGATMPCPFGTSAVNVSASNNGVTFSGAADLNITVTDFVVGGAPDNTTVAPGRSAVYTVTVSPQNGPFRSEITLSCVNLPPSTACSFDPPTLTPGATAARSTLTLTTGASSAASLTDRHERAGSGDWRLQRMSPMILMWPAVLFLAVWIGRSGHRRRVAFAVGVSLAVALVVGRLAMAGLGGIAPALSASSMASGIAIFPASLDFGTQTVSTTTAQKLVSITNIGADTLNLRSISTVGDFNESTTCVATLAAGVTCQVAVKFTPTGVGTRTGMLSIVDDAAGSPHTVGLTGAGQAAPATGGATPAGSYSVTINGVAGSLTHSTSVTLTVQ